MTYTEINLEADLMKAHNYDDYTRRDARDRIAAAFRQILQEQRSAQRVREQLDEHVARVVDLEVENKRLQRIIDLDVNAVFGLQGAWADVLAGHTYKTLLDIGDALLELYKLGVSPARQPETITTAARIAALGVTPEALEVVLHHLMTGKQIVLRGAEPLIPPIQGVVTEPAHTTPARPGEGHDV